MTLIKVNRSRPVCRILCGDLKGHDHLEDLVIDKSVILKVTSKKWFGRIGNGFMRFRIWKNVYQIPGVHFS